jgi:hypothetical protein
MIGLIEQHDKRYRYGHEDTLQSAKEDDSGKSRQSPLQLHVPDASDGAEIPRIQKADGRRYDNCGQRGLGHQGHQGRQEQQDSDYHGHSDQGGCLTAGSGL